MRFGRHLQQFYISIKIGALSVGNFCQSHCLSLAQNLGFTILGRARWSYELRGDPMISTNVLLNDLGYLIFHHANISSKANLPACCRVDGFIIYFPVRKRELRSYGDWACGYMALVSTITVQTIYLDCSYRYMYLKNHKKSTLLYFL